MHRLTREVRFAINAAVDRQLQGRAFNGFGGFPALTGLGHYFALDVTLSGDLTPATSYLRNIKEIDDVVRRRVVPLIARAIDDEQFGAGGNICRETFDTLHNAWPGAALDGIALKLSPFLSLSVLATEHPMVRLSQKFEFSASHRLHNPALSDAQNREAFGKCNNPHGHGHNYELQVTLLGAPDANGLVMDIPRFEQIVDESVIQHFDHKNLNIELPEFRELNPSVENIARVIHQLLKPQFVAHHVKLAAVTVWETPKTWCEYSE